MRLALGPRSMARVDGDARARDWAANSWVWCGEAPAKPRLTAGEHLACKTESDQRQKCQEDEVFRHILSPTRHATTVNGRSFRRPPSTAWLIAPIMP